MIEFRKADSGDINTIVGLRIEFLKEAQKNHADIIHDKVLGESLHDYFCKNMNNGQFIAWLAVDEKKIVGTSGLCFYTTPPSYKNRTGRIAYIMNMYTLPSHRRMGIARHLFARILDEAKEVGVKKICLHATEDGRGLYEKFGFEGTDDEMILSVE